jgi:hypothetical protein
MAAKSSEDRFAQLAYLQVTESAANTLTFAKLEVATGALLGKQKFGLVIHQIQYMIPPTTRKLLLDEDDVISIAITSGDNLTSIDLESVDVIDNLTLGLNKYGAAASGWGVTLPIVHDFSPFGSLLVAADRLYMAVKGLSLASACAVKCRIWYTMKELSVDEYWDLVESRRIITT